MYCGLKGKTKDVRFTISGPPHPKHFIRKFRNFKFMRVSRKEIEDQSVISIIFFASLQA